MGDATYATLRGGRLDLTNTQRTSSLWLDPQVLGLLAQIRHGPEDITSGVLIGAVDRPDPEPLAIRLLIIIAAMEMPLAVSDARP